MDPKVKAILDELNAAFAAFKSSNDERLKQIEAKGSADGALVASVERANADITRLQNELKDTKSKLREVETAAARLVPAGSPEAREKEVFNASQFLMLSRGTKEVPVVSDADLETYRGYRNAFSSYLRRGGAVSADIHAALQTGQAPAGGFWVVPETSARILEWIEDLSGLRQFATVQPIGTDTWEGWYDLDESDAGWVGETDTRAEKGTPRVDGKFTINVHEQYANPKTSQKNLDDSMFDVEAWLAKKVGQKLAKKENTAFVSGDGVMQPKGFLSETMLETGPVRTSVIGYRKVGWTKTGVNGGYAAAPNGGDVFLDVISKLPSELRQGATFAMNQTTLAATRKLKDSNGNYLFIPDFATNPNGSILGYGIVELNDMDNIAQDKYSVAFANWGEAYTILDHRVGIRTLRDPYTGKPYVSFYTTKRVGGQMVNFQAIHLIKFSA